MANNLAQQASGFQSNRGKFGFLKKLDALVCQIGQSSFRPMHNATICSAELSSVKSDGSISEIGGSRISRITDESNKMMTTDPND
jgi:hypothetical protein